MHDEIQRRVNAVRQARTETQVLATIAADLLGITPAEVVSLAQKRIEIKDMLEQLQQGNNQYIATLLKIYDALGYSDQLPELEQGEILHAIDAVHRAALAKGYTWAGDGYAKGADSVGLEYVRGRVVAEMGVTV